MLWRVFRQVRHFPRRTARVALVLSLLAAVTWWADPLHLYTLAAAAVVWAGALTWWVAYRLLVPLTPGAWVSRRDEEADYAGGVATRLDIGEHASAGAMRKRATTLRPSLRSRSRFGRRRTPVTAYAVELLRSGWYGPTSRVYSSCEEVTLRVGGPRSGKSGSLACHALDAPGALLVTTSRTDLLDGTRAHRSRLGRVDVFNPTGLGDLESSVRWSPLAGCRSLGTAQRRAADLIPPSTGEAERWDEQARGLLAILMHAAALAGGSMRTVVDWVSPPDAVARDQVLAALTESVSGRELSAQIRAIYSTNDRTLTSITATLLPAVRWLSEETAALVGDADLGDPDFLDVRQLVEAGCDSLYLIGREGACRPLIGALTAEVAHQVRMVAAARPGGRLDPPMTALLDEAPLTCGPIPLHDWTSDMGGRGLTLHVVAQSLAQLRDVWGGDRANAILGNTASLLVFGGLKAADDLDRLSTLTGNRLVQLDEDDRRPVPVMTPAEIASLPSGTALLIRNGMRPVIGKAPMIWHRKPPITTRAARALTPPAWMRTGAARVGELLTGAGREVVTEYRAQRAKAQARAAARRAAEDQAPRVGAGTDTTGGRP